MKTSGHQHSPRWIKRLLFTVLDEKIAEACLGDLEEKFQHRIQKNTSPSWAAWLYIIEGLGFVRMSKVKENHSIQIHINMLNHTLMFFTRLVRRDSGYYMISILGMSLSLVSFLLIMMFIRDELSYDEFHAEKDRLYRVTTHLRLSDVEYNLA